MKKLYWVIAIGIFSFNLSYAQEEDDSARPSWRSESEVPERGALPPEMEKPKFEFSVNRDQLMGMGNDDPEPESAEAAVAETEAVSAPIEEVPALPDPEPVVVTAVPIDVDSIEAEQTQDEEPQQELVVDLPESAPVIASIETQPDPLALPEQEAVNRAGDQPYRLVRLSAKPPEYPKKARIDRIEGWVDVAVTVSPDGTISDTRIRDAKPRRVFERSALRAVSGWRFSPPMEDGVREDQTGVYRLEFVLSDT